MYTVAAIDLILEQDKKQTTYKIAVLRALELALLGQERALSPQSKWTFIPSKVVSMNRRLTLLAVLISIAGSAALSGCAARVESLKDISLNTRYNVSGQNQMDVPILIKPMVEDRNRDFSVVVPAVPFWYSALNNYPDSSAAFGGRLGVLIGDLPTSFPFMLARELREARLSPNVVVFQALNYESSPSDFPIHIEGSIKECSIYAGVNPIPAGIVAILGVPMGGVRFEMEIEIEVIDAATGRRLGNHEYDYRKASALGMYYGYEFPQKQFVVAMEEFMEEMIEDIERDLEVWDRPSKGSGGKDSE